MTFLRHFPGSENLPFGGPAVVSWVVCMPLWMPAGAVTPKSSSVSLGVGEKPSGVPWMAGFAPACPAGRIPFWASGLAGLVGRMAPGNSGWKRRPVKICGATGWKEERKRQTKSKGHILMLVNQLFSFEGSKLGQERQDGKVESEKIIKIGHSSEEMPPSSEQAWCWFHDYNSMLYFIFLRKGKSQSWEKA